MHGGRIFTAFIVGAVTVSLALLPVQAVGATGGSCAADPAWGESNAALASEVVGIVNGHRATLGLAALTVSPTLTRAAQFKSAHMAGGGYLAHHDPAPLDRTAAERLADCGYVGRTWAENIGKGYGTARAAVEGWLKSIEGHKQNIESAAHTEIGVGVVTARDGTRYWTQEFGAGAAAPRLAPVPLAPPTPAPAAEQVVLSVTRTVARRVTTRRGLLKKRRARSMKLRAARGARNVAMSVKVKGKGWARVKLNCAGTTIVRRAKTRRPAKVRLGGVTASRCTITLRSRKKAMRYRVHAVIS